MYLFAANLSYLYRAVRLVCPKLASARTELCPWSVGMSNATSDALSARSLVGAQVLICAQTLAPLAAKCSQNQL